jgi:hypothetical protein
MAVRRWILRLIKDLSPRRCRAVVFRDELQESDRWMTRRFGDEAGTQPPGSPGMELFPCATTSTTHEQADSSVSNRRCPKNNTTEPVLAVVHRHLDPPSAGSFLVPAAIPSSACCMFIVLVAAVDGCEYGTSWATLARNPESRASRQSFRGAYSGLLISQRDVMPRIRHERACVQEAMQCRSQPRTRGPSRPTTDEFNTFCGGEPFGEAS